MKLSLGFLVVRLQAGGRRLPLMLPLPLFVFEEALEAVAALVRLGLLLRWRPLRRLQTIWATDQLAQLIWLPALLLRRLRHYGPLVLVDVRHGSTRVSIRIV